MTLQVSAQQSTANALATFLAARFPDVTVTNRWPDPGRPLPAKAITVLLAGARTIDEQEPTVVSQATVSGNLVEYTYDFGTLTQPLQLDVWAQSHALRDDLLVRLDGSLRAGSIPSLGLTYGEAVSNTLLLPLPVGTAAYNFDEPSLVDFAQTKQQAEYRAIWTGEAQARLLIKATSPKIARIEIRMWLHESPLGTAQPQTGHDVIAITSTSVTRTHVTP